MIIKINKKYNNHSYNKLKNQNILMIIINNNIKFKDRNGIFQKKKKNLIIMYNKFSLNNNNKFKNKILHKINSNSNLNKIKKFKYQKIVINKFKNKFQFKK